MWLFLPNSMLSIVQKPGDAKAGTLTVRGRIAGDIEAVFPDAVVSEGAGTDYRFRATIRREQVAKAMHDAVMNLNWANFKAQVKERRRHDAYMGCWQAMFHFQESRQRPRQMSASNKEMATRKSRIPEEDDEVVETMKLPTPTPVETWADWPAAKTISLDLNFSDADMERMRRGCVPSSDDDKWVVCFDGDACRFSRASDFDIFFDVKFARRDGGGWVAHKCVANRLATENMELSERLVNQLLRWCLLGQTPC